MLTLSFYLQAAATFAAAYATLTLYRTLLAPPRRVTLFPVFAFVLLGGFAVLVLVDLLARMYVRAFLDGLARGLPQ